jgi:hypothetical protein
MHVVLKKPAQALKPAVVLAENACARASAVLKADANVLVINAARNVTAKKAITRERGFPPPSLVKHKKLLTKCFRGVLIKRGEAVKQPESSALQADYPFT